MRLNLDWQPYFEIADQDLPYRDRLRAYAQIAHQRFETGRFQEFCQQHLGHLDEVAYELFGSQYVRDAGPSEGVGPVPAARDRGVHRAVLGPHRGLAGPGGRERVKEVSRWWTPRLECGVTVARWGHWGEPVLLFPTTGGDAEEIERCT